MLQTYSCGILYANIIINYKLWLNNVVVFLFNFQKSGRGRARARAREGGREGASEGGREGGREGRREGGREGRREAGRRQHTYESHSMSILTNVSFGLSRRPSHVCGSADPESRPTNVALTLLIAREAFASSLVSHSLNRLFLVGLSSIPYISPCIYVPCMSQWVGGKLTDKPES